MKAITRDEEKWEDETSLSKAPNIANFEENKQVEVLDVVLYTKKSSSTKSHTFENKLKKIPNNVVKSVLKVDLEE